VAPGVINRSTCLQVPRYCRCSLQHAASAKAYVDDIAIFAHTVEDMRKQIHKLDLWSAHACIKVNASKCAVTGVLDGSCAQGICADAADNRQLTRFLHQTLQVSGQFVPYLPPFQPNRYPGWHISLALDWTTQFHDTLEKIQHLRHQLQQCNLSSRQVLQVIESNIRHIVTCAFGLARFTLHQIDQLDVKFAYIVRKWLLFFARYRQC
jgi:hypothetical protein